MAFPWPWAIPWPSASRPLAFGHTSRSLRPSHGLLEALESIKIAKKCPKRKNFHLPRQFTQPPGGQIKKRQSHSVRLDQKSISAKFRPNLLTFEATSLTKTDERRRTPCNLGVASRLWIGGLRPPGGVASRPLFFARTALKKGTTSLRSVVNKYFLHSEKIIEGN